MSAAPVVVAGGGLAGISAALALADAGLRVTLLEARGRLGGATYSFRRDGTTGRFATLIWIEAPAPPPPGRRDAGLNRSGPP